MRLETIRRIHRLIVMTVAAFTVALVLNSAVPNSAVPAWAHNGVVHGDEPENVQAVPDESPQESVAPESPVETEVDSTTVASDSSQPVAAEDKTRYASIGLGEILLGSIVVGPIALLQLKARL